MSYPHKEIEKKWQKEWTKKEIFKTNLFDEKKPKKYILAMFPYPSGSGLHLGHVRNYTVADVFARYYRLIGYNVLFPIGWDSFGLPAEQYAIKTGNHPEEFTKKNIDNFRQQLISLGFSFDWSKEINTSDSNYYRWTQWIFLQMYKKGLVNYRDETVYWCPELKTVLANEEILLINQKEVSERGGFPVEKKFIPQWILKITDYAEKLLENFDQLDWPEGIKTLQKNWIGKKEGFEVGFFINDSLPISIFIPRLDSLLSLVAIVVSSSSLRIENHIPKDIKNYVINPLNQESIPLFIDDDFLEEGQEKHKAISPFFFTEEEYKICPENDLFTKKEKLDNLKRDFFFAKQKGLLTKRAFHFKSKKLCFFSEQFRNETTVEGANNKIWNILKEEKKGKIKKKNIFHLRDWVFCRQRYWGEPIPIIHMLDGTTKPLNEDELPLVLPFLKNFKPSGSISPLEKLVEWIEVKRDGKTLGKRDSNVMPQWAGSCWYYLAYLIKKNNGEYLPLDDFNAKTLIGKWLPIDVYIGGAEHANLHLLYSRFWHKFLKDIGIVSSFEPFKKLICQGVILGSDGEKMSKSRGNIINPDSLVEEYGNDAVRLCVLFIGPVEKQAFFLAESVRAMRKWLNRIWNLFEINKKENKEKEDTIETSEFKKMVFQCKKYYEEKKFNLVISSLMIFTNFWEKSQKGKIPVYQILVFCQLLNPLAPYISEEIWNNWEKKSINLSVLKNTLELLQEEEIFKKKIIIQINGKTKKVLFLEKEIEKEEELLELIENSSSLREIKEILSKRWVVIKTIFLKGKNNLINFVVKQRNN